MNVDVLAQMVQQNDEKADDGHHRLRTDFRNLEARVLSLEACRTANDVRFTQLAKTPIDVSSLTFPARVVLGAIAVCLTIAGSNWYVAASVQSKMDAQSAMFSNEILELKTQMMSLAQIANERDSVSKEAAADAKKMQELQRIQLESLTKTVLSQRR